MITYPIRFSGESVATPGLGSTWETSASGMAVTCAVPKEFEGIGGELSPEDFYLLALQNCFVATFKVYAHYSNFTFEALKVRAELDVDKSDENQKPMMKEVRLNIELVGPANESKGRLLIKKTMENGFILQSVKTKVTLL
jgi:organic hydroperoxide reductase OsmC/OhrA